VDSELALSVMKGYFADRQPAEALAAFPELSPRDLLKESLDIVDFIAYVEEELGCEIDIAQLGVALLNMNFGELAVDLSRLVVEQRE